MWVRDGGDERGEPAPAPRTVGSPLRTLIIDDDLDLLAAVTAALQREGHAVVGVSDADMRADSETPALAGRPLGFDLIVVDQRLPSSTGVELITQMRRAGHDVPVVIATAYPTDDLASTAARMGACEVLDKPFELQALLDAIDRVLAINHVANFAPAPRR